MPFGSPSSPRSSRGSKSPRNSLIAVNGNNEKNVMTVTGSLLATRDSVNSDFHKLSEGISESDGNDNSSSSGSSGSSGSDGEKMEKRKDTKVAAGIAGVTSKSAPTGEDSSPGDGDRGEKWSDDDFASLNVSVRTVDILLKGEEGIAEEEGEEEGDDEGDDEDEDDDDDEDDDASRIIHK